MATAKDMATVLTMMEAVMISVELVVVGSLVVVVVVVKSVELVVVGSVVVGGSVGRSKMRSLRTFSQCIIQDRTNVTLKQIRQEQMLMEILQVKLKLLTLFLGFRTYTKSMCTNTLK